ncbi:VWA domain-containing protein [Chryseolinea lacunae]|uniref:VWA domain-containing protein n=1 Tax=Chryseolinea lacunae TaxID=2801331 RepID=A0ABS1KQ87_9BACT|nr:VWA domain-containing protein [Chryseolinea lacunae]MBL0741630.1 VWA domain-containing protein [Chryseolinea lacunae]
MHQQRIIFESSPAYILVCVILGLGFAFLLYRTSHPWSKMWNRILFGCRAVLAFFLMFLLLGPVVKQISNLFERPLFLVVYDNSTSVKETTDSTTRHQLETKVAETQQLLQDKGYETRVTDLAGKEIERPTFNATLSDLGGTLKKIVNRFEGSRIGGVILVSDGIYNGGISPLYTTYNFPIYTVGIGDTLERTDILIKNIAYNKIVYQGNKFPVRVEVMVKNLPNQAIKVSLLQAGKVLETQSKISNTGSLLTYDFQPQANDQGIQKLDVRVELKEGETNARNNNASIFVEVVEGKKKILVVAPSPHPDIKALREVIDKNPNYEFLLHIPGVQEQPANLLRPDQIDLAIFHQSPDLRGKTRELFQQFAGSSTALFVIVGMQTDLLAMSKQNMPLKFEVPPRDYDEVTPATNAAFSHFIISAETNALMASYPPVSVHFGKVRMPPTATPLLFQKVGSLTTEKPLLLVDVQNTRKVAIMLGEGLWRWKLNEFDRNENSQAFDEVFSKLVQYLSTSEDKRKFRSYPIQQEFSDTEPVVFESQVYNDIFEPIFGHTINIELTDEAGKKTKYAYTTSPGNIRYQIGGLKEGVYRYTSKTTLDQKPEQVRGQFAVVQRQTELQNLTADFDLLRKLSAGSGGKFYTAANLEPLKAELQKAEARSIIHSEESYHSLINLKWIFWILLLMVSVEWFARKFFGSY